jgi:hypothetical protein
LDTLTGDLELEEEELPFFMLVIDKTSVFSDQSPDWVSFYRYRVSELA